MYYSDYSRIRKLQKLIERVAYISVATDFLIAISTYLVIKNVQYSNSLLLLSDYLDFLIVALIAMMVSLAFLLKLHENLGRRIRLSLLKISDHQAYRLMLIIRNVVRNTISFLITKAGY